MLVRGTEATPCHVPNSRTLTPHPQCAVSSPDARYRSQVHPVAGTHTRRDSPMSIPGQELYPTQGTLQRGFLNSNFLSIYQHRIPDAERFPRSAFQSHQRFCIPPRTHVRLGLLYAGRNAALSHLRVLHSPPPHSCPCPFAHTGSTPASLATPNIRVHTVHPAHGYLRRSPTTNAAHITHVHTRPPFSRRAHTLRSPEHSQNARPPGGLGA